MLGVRIASIGFTIFLKCKGDSNRRMLTLQKGVDILCQCIRVMNDYDFLRKGLEFWIVGSGPLHFLVERTARSCGNVMFFEKVEDDVLPGIYGGCDFLLCRRVEKLLE